MLDPDDLLLSDAERLHALTVLGDHYAAGRLDNAEFHARSGDVAAARTLGQLHASFADLPGGTPLSVADGVLVRTTAPDAGDPGTSSSYPGSSYPGSVTPTGTSLPSHVSPSGVVATPSGPDSELEELRRRGRLVESADGVIIGLTLVAFLVLQFVVGWNHAWIVWPSLILTMGIPRLVLRFSDSDEETYEALKEAEQQAREERLRAATERIHELGDGRERRG